MRSCTLRDHAEDSAQGERGDAHEPYRSRNDFALLTEIEDRLRRFQDHDERAATSFQSTFTRRTCRAHGQAAKDRVATRREGEPE
jgi:hypothetical protein